MNHIKADTGKLVVAVGAPGSVKRVEVQYPILIHNIRKLHSWADAEAALRFKGFSRLETNSILFAAGHIPEA